MTFFQIFYNKDVDFVNKKEKKEKKKWLVPSKVTSAIVYHIGFLP